jgi:DNA-binding response OmpR family regulator
MYRNLTALVVEDDIQSANHLKSILEDIFFEIYIANDGDEGLDIFYEKKPDMIFADIMMPKKNGIELIKQIRNVDKEIKIVVISGYNTQEYLMEAVKLKLEDFLVKPIQFEPFLALLSKIANDCKEKYPSNITLSSGAIFQLFNKTILFEDTTYILTKSEFKLLMLLLTNTNNIVNKDVIEQYLWQDGSLSDTALKSLVNKLRKKVGKNAIESQSGYGYKVVI